LKETDIPPASRKRLTNYVYTDRPDRHNRGMKTAPHSVTLASSECAEAETEKQKQTNRRSA